MPPEDTTPHRIGGYELHSKIASGGMATVYFGKRVGAEGFSRIVAIKRMHPHLAEDESFRAMFIDEARLASQIHHPNVAPILDLVADGDELLLVMGYVRGATVSSLMRNGGALPVGVAVRVALDALLGLHAAHTAKGEGGLPLGIVHRDVSPQNLIVSAEGGTVVVDFGVAKAAERLQTSSHGELKGKLAYMAPEQLRGRELGPFTDVYAVGIVLWEMLTGERRFAASSNAALLGLVLDGETIGPRDRRTDIPEAVDAVVRRAIDRDPTERYATARAMADALTELGVASSAREVAEIVEARAKRLLEERDEHQDASAARPPATLSRVRPEVLEARREGAPPARAAGAEVLEDVPPAAPRRVRRGVWIALLASGLLGFAVQWLRGREAEVPAGTEASARAGESPPVSVPAESARPEGSVSPSLPEDAGAAPAEVASSKATPRRRPPASPPGTTQGRTRPAVDCAKNPRVLGPDGVYQVRKECLGP